MALFLIVFVIILALMLGWHLAFPIIGGIIALSGVAWGLLVATIAVFCLGVMGLFLFSGIGLIFLVIIGLIWTVLAIAFFPILFPIVAPLFIILLFASYHRRKQLKKNLPPTNR